MRNPQVARCVQGYTDAAKQLDSAVILFPRAAWDVLRWRARSYARGVCAMCGDPRKAHPVHRAWDGGPYIKGQGGLSCSYRGTVLEAASAVYTALKYGRD